MSQEPPAPNAARQLPSRRRGRVILAVGALYSVAQLALAWLFTGWLAWGVAISGVLAGGMLMALGMYMLRLDAEPGESP